MNEMQVTVLAKDGQWARFSMASTSELVVLSDSKHSIAGVSRGGAARRMRLLTRWGWRAA